MKTRIGPLQLAVPQVRGAKFYPQALERGTRSEKALLAALAEMYVQGVSTAKVTKITEELCGCEISSSDVSRATALLDEEFEKWRNRPLGQVKYLILSTPAMRKFARPARWSIVRSWWRSASMSRDAVASWA
jgi:transposase-like protein